MDALFLSCKKLPDGSPAWDLALNSAGNIIVATGAYAIAQNVASAVRVFQGECWYDATKGVPYSQQILGQTPSYQLMKARFASAAASIRGVGSITTYLTGPDRAHRGVGGQMQITTSDGTVVVVTSPAIGVAPWYARAIDVYAL